MIGLDFVHMVQGFATVGHPNWVVSKSEVALAALCFMQGTSPKEGFTLNGKDQTLEKAALIHFRGDREEFSC